MKEAKIQFSEKCMWTCIPLSLSLSARFQHTYTLHTIQFKGVHSPGYLVFPGLSTIPTYFIGKIFCKTPLLELNYYLGGVKLFLIYLN